MDSALASPVINGGNIRSKQQEGVPDAVEWNNGIFHARSVAEIKTTLRLLHERESAVTARLDALLASQKELSRELGRLDFLRANLGTQSRATRAIGHGMLDDAAATAERISSAVNRLDVQQSRVRSTLDVVEQVIEFKACVLGVAGSMGASQDWETAATYIHRALKIPTDVVNGSFAAEMVPTAEVPDPPRVTLENAAESLCGLFLREFERAVKENDGAKITRFFKLFPLIDRSDVGLDVYGSYVCHGVAQRARTNLHAVTGSSQSGDGVFYVNALTRLFEHIAQIVEGHGPLVERHYGTGKMTRVIQRLQVEADVQGSIILESWSDERHIDRKLTDIKSYAFAFLVQSFLPATRTSGIMRTGSPALRDASAQQQISEDEGVDMKEIDALLNEMSVMLGKWSLYCRFIAGKCKEEKEARVDHLQIPKWLVESSLGTKIGDRLITPLNVMTTFFLRRSVEKAFQLDENPSGLTLNRNRPLGSNPPYITSSVDDIMYIVKKVLQQSLATAQLSVVTNVVPTLSRVLGSDFIGMIQRRMRDESYPRALVTGGLPPEATIISFLVLINSLDVAVDYVRRIVKSHLETLETSTAESAERPQPQLMASFPAGKDAETVENALRSLSASFESKAQDLVGDGIQVVFNNVIKLHLRPALADAFRDMEYQRSHPDGQDEDDEVDELAAQFDRQGLLDGVPVVRRRFASAWVELMGPISRILTARAFDRLLGLTVASLARLLEKRIWSYHGRVDNLGATRLERDVMGIVASSLDVASAGSGEGSSASGGRYRHREAFARCIQIVTVMGMEEEEWEEISRDGGKAVDRLSVEEQARARSIVSS